MLLKNNISCGKNKAFSLIEVVISLGIVSFAFLGIIALFPVGMKSNRDSVEETRALNLLHTMVADWQTTAWSTNSAGPLPSPIYNLTNFTFITTSISNTNSPIYINEDGSTNSSSASAFYRVTYTIYPNTGYMQPALVNLKATWPAGSATPTSGVEILSTFLP